MGFDRVAPAKPAAFSTLAPSSASPAPSSHTSKPADAKTADAKPVEVKRTEPKPSGLKPSIAVTAPQAPGIDKTKSEKASAGERVEPARPRRDDRRLAARSELPPPNAPVSTAIPAVSPNAAAPTMSLPDAAKPSAATPEAAKPLSRSEQRRAAREARRQAAADLLAPPAQPAPAVAPNPLQGLFGLPQQPARAAPVSTGRGQIDALVSHHARLNGVPESLVHRVIIRESRYNPGAVGRGGAMGLMQIKTATARGVGYTGGPAGLLDAETNLTYGIKYLAGAWRVSGGSHDRAVSHYARGYYYAAKRMGVAGRRGRQAEPETTAAVPQQAPSLFSLFSPAPR